MITKQEGFIQYDEIRKLKRAFYSHGYDDQRDRPLYSFRQLELELKNRQPIIFEERELINLLETEKYIRARITKPLS